MEISMSVFLLVVGFVLVGALVVFLIREQFSESAFEHSLVGVWFNENLNVRILLYDVDSVFQGSVVWAENQNNSILGQRVFENLRVGLFNKCKGVYVDPGTSRQYNVSVQLKGKNTLNMIAYESNSNEVAFVQEWKLLKS